MKKRTLLFVLILSSFIIGCSNNSTNRINEEKKTKENSIDTEEENTEEENTEEDLSKIMADREFEPENDGVKYKINSVSNTYITSYGDVLQIWFDVTNESEESQFVANNLATFYGPNGTEITSGMISPNDKEKTIGSGKIRNGVTTTTVETCIYDGDGTYVMEFNLLGYHYEFEFFVEKKEKEEGGMTITYPSTTGDIIYQAWPTE